jgi:hypothetical protein
MPASADRPAIRLHNSAADELLLVVGVDRRALSKSVGSRN